MALIKKEMQPREIWRSAASPESAEYQYRVIKGDVIQACALDPKDRERLLFPDNVLIIADEAGALEVEEHGVGVVLERRELAVSSPA